jgi:hypothetical protein
VVARSVELVVRGGGNPSDAEALLLEEAGKRDPRDLFRWGLGLVHQLAPKEMEAEEERRVERRFLRMTEAFDGGCDIVGYGGNDKRFSRQILARMGLSEQAIAVCLTYFEDHRGRCDCEVVFNLDGQE